MTAGRAPSLRRQLWWWVLVTVALFGALSALQAYRSALQAAHTAYDRTLLASAKTIGEQLRVAAADGDVRLSADMPYAALEAFEADMRSRMFYRVLGFRGETVSGYADLPAPRAQGDERNPYAALVHFYDEAYRGEPVRMAVLLQPVSDGSTLGMATVQVAETMELRRRLADDLLAETLVRQALQVALMVAVLAWAVQRLTRPVRALGARLEGRAADDLSPLPSNGAPRELLPLIEASNHVMARLERLLAHQKRFVRDASHQLRTPLAVLKAQIQSAERGDVDASTALAEIRDTVDRATTLANQLLALAKVEQLHGQHDLPLTDWAGAVREVAIDLSALVVAHGLDFELDAPPTWVQAHPWALRELTRNLLHNAIKHGPPRGRLHIRLAAQGPWAMLTVSDDGPGLTTEQRQTLFQPFASGGAHAGAGLGLVICREIAESLGGNLTLVNRAGAEGRDLTAAGGRVGPPAEPTSSVEPDFPAEPAGAAGLDAIVRVPLAQAPRVARESLS